MGTVHPEHHECKSIQWICDFQVHGQVDAATAQFTGGEALYGEMKLILSHQRKGKKDQEREPVEGAGKHGSK